MPFDGKSYALIGVASGGYVLSAVAYSLLSRQRPAGGSPSPSAVSPSAAAQRSSS
jgi:hypothetical protein